MNNDKQLTIESTVKEEIRENKTAEILATGRYKPYKQNRVIDNTIRELANYKQLDMWDNAVSVNVSRTAVFELQIQKYTELEEYLSKELYNEGKANQSAGKLLDSLLISLAEKGFNTPRAELSLKDYAKLTGKKDMKELRKRTRADIEILKRVYINEEPRKKNKRNQY